MTMQHEMFMFGKWLKFLMALPHIELFSHDNTERVNGAVLTRCAFQHFVKWNSANSIQPEPINASGRPSPMMLFIKSWDTSELLPASYSGYMFGKHLWLETLTSLSLSFFFFIHLLISFTVPLRIVWWCAPLRPSEITLEAEMRTLWTWHWVPNVNTIQWWVSVIIITHSVYIHINSVLCCSSFSLYGHCFLF